MPRASKSVEFLVWMFAGAKKLQAETHRTMPIRKLNICSSPHNNRSRGTAQAKNKKPVLYPIMFGLIPNSRSCLGSTVDGASVNIHTARWLFGNAMTSLSDFAPLRRSEERRVGKECSSSRPHK